MTPEEVVSIARHYNCLGVSWTYNEPTIWLEYTIDCAKASKEAGLITHYVTNGYITEEALDAIGPYLDCFRVDIKGFTEGSYFKTAHIKDFSPILRATKRAKERWGMHVECVTNVTPGFNDDDSQLRGIASWIIEELGQDTPWHVTRFIPHHKLAALYPTPVETLERARKIGFDVGLRYVYIGNIPGHEGENTRCHNCNKPLIEREGFLVMTYNLKGNQCPFCRTPIPGRFPERYGEDYKTWEGYEVGVI
jgi:pyruvate formate lyase activating enzyme